MRNYTLTEFELKELLGKDWEAQIKNTNIKLLRRKRMMDSLDMNHKYYHEDTDGGYETNFFELKILSVIDANEGLIETIEPNSSGSRTHTMRIEHILTQKEFIEDHGGLVMPSELNVSSWADNLSNDMML